jgi:hypothetical protein
MVPRRLSRPAAADLVRVLLAVTAVLAATSCDQDFTDPSLIDEDEAKITAVSGNGQSAALGSLLPLPLRVQVRDERGHPAPQQRVDFRLLVGSGLFSSLSGVTDFAGFTQVRFVPTSEGNLAVEASVAGGGPEGRTIFSLQAIDSSEVRNPASFLIAGGDGQVGAVGTILPQPLTVVALNADGNPIERLPILFTATTDGTLLLTARAGDFTTIDSLGNQPVASDSTLGRQIVSFTNENGVGAVLVRLATRPGTNQVTASSTAFGGGNSTVVFNLTGELGGPGSASQIEKVSGDQQAVTVDTTCVGLPPREFNPMVVAVTDRFGNPVEGASVVFRISSGSGTLSAGSGEPCTDDVCVETTDAGGFAAARYTSAAGEFGGFVVSASAPGVGSALFTGLIEIATVVGDTIPIVCDLAPAPQRAPLPAELSQAPVPRPPLPTQGESRAFALPEETRRKWRARRAAADADWFSRSGG